MITLFTLKLWFVNMCLLAIVLLLINYTLDKLLDKALNEWKNSIKMLNELENEEITALLQSIKDVVDEDDIISNHNNKIRAIIDFYLENYNKKESSENSGNMTDNSI